MVREIMETHDSRWKGIKPVGHLMMACLLFSTGSLLIVPFMADIMLGAFCPGQLQCSRVVLLQSCVSLGTGLGSVFLGPILGSVSDDYGRKPILFVLFWISVVPPAILAYSLRPMAVYFWYGSIILISVSREGGLLPTILAYVADSVGERERSSAVGFTMASLSVGIVVGTLAAFVVTTKTQAMLTIVVMQTAAAIYFTIFVKESNPRKLPLSPEQPQSETLATLLPKPEIRRQTTKLRDAAMTICSSKLLKVVAVVDFINSFALASTQTFALYYLKAKFNFGKDEYASYNLITSFSHAAGMMLYPMAANHLGDRATLCIGIVGAAIYYLLFAVAWNFWVAYIAVTFSFIYSFVTPALGTMVSKGVDADQQGRVQGYMGGVRSTGVILAPLVMTPLTANSVSESPFFNTKGLPYFVCFAATIVAFFVALGTPSMPASERKEKLSATEYIEAAQPPCILTPPPRTPEDLLHVPIHPQFSTESAEAQATAERAAREPKDE